MECFDEKNDEENEEVSDEEDVNLGNNKIYWVEDENLFFHISGISFNLDESILLGYDDHDDIRVLY